MKRLTILLMAVCMIALVGCENKVTYNISDDEKLSMMTIEEAGGRAVREVAGIVEFLQTADYAGVFFTDAGKGGFKIKDGKIYFAEQKEAELESDNVRRYKMKWTEIEISYNDIAVDKSLNKLQYNHPDNGLEVLTFDGFGYYYYIDGGGLPKYYKKYDYVEDKYEGIWKNTSGSGKLDRLEIYEDYMRRHMVPDSLNKNGSYDNLTDSAPFKDDTLNIKGWNGDKVVFNSDQKTATYYYNDGSTDIITRQ